jgi:poly(glycerol-phosphate) alpha-glucosyltransferase
VKTATLAASVTRQAGGLFDSLLGTCRELSKLAGMQETVLSLDDGPAPDDLARWVGVLPQRFPVHGPQFFGFSPELKRALLGGNFDLVHAHGLWQFPSTAVNTWHRRTRRPYLVSPHGMLDPWAIRHSAWKKRIALLVFERSHLHRATCLRALCEAEARAIRAFGLKNPIAIIPNGVDLPPDGGRRTEDGRQPSALCPLPSDRKVLLYLGRIHPKKGLVNLLKAWKSVVGGPVVRGPSSVHCPPSSDWLLAIAGWDQGGHEAELKRLCDELGISWKDTREHRTSNNEHPTTNPKAERGNQKAEELAATVLFLGPQFGDAKSACYANCDAFILPSFSEGLPMVVLEAWAYAKPVLMTPECNLPEGFAANAAIRIETNAESIALGLTDLFRLPSSALCSLGSRGRSLVATRFTWPQIAREMRGVYEWALGGGEKPSCIQTA